LTIFTGFTEEIIFRGLLQGLAVRMLGRWALVYISLLFAIMHIAYRSPADLLFVFVVGLLFAYIVYWSGSILGVTLVHSTANITLFLIMPLIANDITNSAQGPLTYAIWVGLLITSIGVSILIWRAGHSGRLLVGKMREGS
jgi:hypothetical protein